MHDLPAVRRTLVWTLFANLAVALSKMFWGGRIGSVAMQADGYHSLVDACGNVVGLVGISAAHRPADEGHPYGHRKFETFAALGVAVLVLETALEVLQQAWGQIWLGSTAEPDPASMAVMTGALAVNLAVTFWESRVGRRLHSDFLLADAAHTMSDVFVSLGVLSSLALGYAGVRFLDPYVGIAVSVIIVHTGLQILRRAVPVLLDAEAIPAAELERHVLSDEAVASCHKIRSRGRSDDVKIDLHIQVDPELSVEAGHSIAHRVKAVLLERFPQVTDVLIHVEPARRDGGGEAARPPSPERNGRS